MTWARRKHAKFGRGFLATKKREENKTHSDKPKTFFSKATLHGSGVFLLHYIGELLQSILN